MPGGDLSLHSAELSAQVIQTAVIQGRQIDDWKRKLLHLRSDAALKRNLRQGIVSESTNWSEGYVRRSVKKKVQKAMFCEVCGVKIASYLEHYDTPEHRAHIHSPFYFEFLNDFFTHLLVAAWRRDNHAETIPDSAAGDPNPLTCCFSSTEDQAVWLFPRFYAFVGRSEASSAQLKESVARVAKMPLTTLLFPSKKQAK